MRQDVYELLRVGESPSNTPASPVPNLDHQFVIQHRDTSTMTTTTTTTTTFVDEDQDRPRLMSNGASKMNQAKNGTRPVPAGFPTGDFVTPGAIMDESHHHMDESVNNRKQTERSRENMMGSRKTTLDFQQQSSQGYHSERGRQDPIGNGTMQADAIRTDKLREAFLIFDRDADGRITSAEMTRVMHSLGYHPSPKEIADMFDRADSNRNGTIEFDEFIQVVKDEFSEANPNSRRTNLDDDLLAIFEIFDLNKDGRITAQELNHAMTVLGENLSKSELDDMMRTADSNGDGAIDFQEFQNLFRSPANKLALMTSS